jgi:hypothetical protein
VKTVAQTPRRIELGAYPDKPPRWLAAVVNPVIYYLRTNFRRLEILPTEFPPLVCVFRWFLKGFRQLWLRAVLLPATERMRPTDQDANLFKAAMPAVADFRLRRVALFCQDPSKYSYVRDLAAVFRLMGVEAIDGHSYLDGKKFRNMLRDFKPDFVLEINRSRNQIPDCDAKFHHIAWIQDYSVGRRRITDGFGGSSKVYSILDPHILGYRAEQVQGWTLLQSAVDPNVHRPTPGLMPRWDVTTIGYLASPLSRCELRAPLYSSGVNTTLSEIQAEFRACGMNHGNLHVPNLESFLLGFMRSRKPDYRPDATFDWLMALYEDRVIRSLDRAGYLRQVISRTDNVGIFGNGQWPWDEQFSRHFSGRIRGGSQRAAIYCLSRIVFHNGQLLVHDRNLEAMSCEACVILNHSIHEDSPSGITPYFTDGEHFAFFDEETLPDLVTELLADDARRARLGRQARKKILDGFTWHHRAQQIVNDFVHH